MKTPHSLLPGARISIPPFRVPAMLQILVAFLTAGWASMASGQVRSQKRITTAEGEFTSPTYGWSATNTLGGITDQGDIFGSTHYFITTPGADGFTALGWRWTFDGGQSFTQPSAANSTPVSAHNLSPYPYSSANQRGLGFLSAEPGGGVLAFREDNRFETPGLTGFLNMDPATTSRVAPWLSGAAGNWLPFVNHLDAVSLGQEFDLEHYSYSGIYPGGNILGSARRQRARVTNFSITPKYWDWQPVAPSQEIVDFMLPGAGSLPRFYVAPTGYPGDRLIQASLHTGKTVGLAFRVNAGNTLDWKGVYWPSPEAPVLIEQIIGIPAYPQHITAAGDIVGVVPSFTGSVSGEPFLREGRLFLWLSKAKWGLPAGLNWLTPAGSNAFFTTMNDRGLLFYQLQTPTGSYESYEWSSGSLRKWSFSSTTWTGLTPIGPVNNKGWVVCIGTRLDNRTEDYVLSYPLMDIDLTVEPKEVEVGDEFELVATVFSRSILNVLNFGPSAVPVIAGDPNATISAAPDPALPQTLPAGGTLTFRWKCRATRAGEARFTAELRGTPSNDPDGIYRSLQMTSDAVTIKKADVIVNLNTDEPDAATSDECADVDLQNPGRQTTLRSALSYVATLPIADRKITFDIPAGTSRRILLHSALPRLPDHCELDGKNKVGTNGWINGEGLPRDSIVLLGGASSKVKNLAFSGPLNGENTGLGFTGGNNEVTGCRFGQNDAGGKEFSFTNSIICEAGPQQIGGAGPAEGNEFLGGEIGLRVAHPTAVAVSGIVVEGNRFGRSSLSRSGPENAIFWINVGSSRIGGTSVGARNIFIRSEKAAVLLAGLSATDNDIAGNWFGLTEQGNLVEDSAFNGYGIGLTLGAHHNRIGGSSPSSRNIISASNSSGILLTRGAHHNVISGNWIGLNSAGVSNPGSNSETGIWIIAGASNRIGGSGASERNVISDNRLNGIRLGREPRQTYNDPLLDPGSEACLDTVIEGNWIGTDHSGAQPVPNGRSWNGGGSGIEILSFASGTIIGGDTPAKRNLISGNHGQGISIAGDAATTTLVAGNHIGTTVDGLGPLPNGGSGLVMKGTSTLLVGGVGPGQGNRIAYNKGTGIDLAGMKAPAPGVVLAGNLLYDNAAQRSIVLAPRRPGNDEGDADTGPNKLQNWPLPVAAINNAGSTHIAYDLQSFARGVTARIDAFTASGGGGSVHIGSQTVTTGADPNDRYVLTAALQFVGSPITLMASTQDGSSEFSPVIKVVSGLDSDGDGLPDALERHVPVSAGNQPRNATLGDRNGDGTPDETQAHVASAQVPEAGAWLTLAASPGRSLTDVTALRGSDVPNLPAGTTVLIGAVRFTLFGGTASTQPLSILYPSQPAATSVWLRNGSTWQPLSGVIADTSGPLARLTFPLPARPPGSTWLLALGSPAPLLSPVKLTLGPPELRPLERPPFSPPISLDSAAPAVEPPGLGLVQPVTITRPDNFADWTLQVTSDLQEWQNVPWPEPTATTMQLTHPLSNGPRFFRWLVP